MSKEIIVHVGLAKTGTTYLQQKVFPNLDLYFEGACYQPTVDCGLFDDFIYLTTYPEHPIYTDKNYVHDYKKRIWEYIDNNNEHNKHKHFFSFESLAGATALNCQFQDKHIEIMKTLFPDAKIFFVFRRQDSYIVSQYNQLFKSRNFFSWGGCTLDYMTLNKITGYRFGKFSPKNEYMNIYKFSWLDFCKKYCNHFGEESILALPYEMFRENPNEFLGRFYKFFDIEPFYPKSNEFVNTSKEKPEYKIIDPLIFYERVLKLLPTSLRKNLRENDKNFRDFLSPFGIYRKKQKLNGHQKKLILDIHNESNRELAELIDIDLGQYGYY